jgi:glycosyltransferase A (GT-A) superfamily protein (DUF2064 family)
VLIVNLMATFVSASSGDNASEGQFSATLVLVAKFPRLGKCKTRLAAHPSVGAQFACDFARASILDILVHFGGAHLDNAIADAMTDNNDNNEINRSHSTPNDIISGASKLQRIVAVAPSDACDAFREWVDGGLGGEHGWQFVPFDASAGATSSTTSAMPANVAASHLSHGLQSLLEVFGVNHRPVVFIGMDTPHLSINQISKGVAIASRERENGSQTTPPPSHTEGEEDKPLARGAQNEPRGYICPATDGGYVMLALPSCASRCNVFDPNVLMWSSTNTFATQVKAITDGGIEIRVGLSYCDVDEREDVCELQHLIQTDPELAASLPRLAALLPIMVEI